MLMMFLLIRGAYYLIYRAIIKIIREIKKSKTTAPLIRSQLKVGLNCKTLGARTAAPLIHRQPCSRAVDTPKAARTADPQPAASYSQTTANPPRTATRLPPKHPPIPSTRSLGSACG